ncbi:MAG: hypothetical protein ACKOTB_17035, partial [Planctomycetia bacterium]
CHGRDAAGTEQVTVWTGPGTRAVLYLPVPPGEQLLVFIDIGGSIQPSVRASLRIRVDGQDRGFERATQHGGIERIIVPVRTTRPYCKLELLVDRTFTPAEAGRAGNDARRLGIALRGYGYRLEPTEGIVLRDTSVQPALGPPVGGAAGMPTSEPQPDLPWIQQITQDWLGHLAGQTDPDRLVDLLAWDVSPAELAAPPTAAGVEHAFRRMHMGPAPRAWLDFWVGRADTTLRHLYRDLASGHQFRQRLERLGPPSH